MNSTILAFLRIIGALQRKTNYTQVAMQNEKHNK